MELPGIYYLAVFGGIGLLFAVVFVFT